MAESTTQKNSAPKKVSAKKVSSATSLEAKVYSQKGAVASSITLPANIFGLKWNGDLVHDVVIGMMANARAGTAHTKNRGEVSGGGKKPWKQKGTGRARHGSSRSPIWVGGGITHGPRSEKDYSKKINKKSRVKALYTILSKKFAEGNILFVDAIALSAIKTKDASVVMNAWSKVDGFAKLSSKKRTQALLVLPERIEMIEKSFANLPAITVVTAAEINALMLSSKAQIIVVAPDAVVATLSNKIANKVAKKIK